MGNMARLTFPIFRLNYLKNVGGVIDEALRRGHSVNLLYDKSMINTYRKGLPSPNQNSFPKFLYGQTVITGFKGLDHLAKISKTISDIFVSHYIPPYDFDEKPYKIIDQLIDIKQAGIPIVSLMSHFYDNCMQKLEAYEFFDANCVLSSFSVEAHKKILLQLSHNPKLPFNYTQSQIDRVINKKVHITGSSLFDLFEPRYHEDQDKHNILVFIPKIDSHPFMNIVLKNQPRLLSLIKSIVRYKGRYFRSALRSPQFNKFLKKLNMLATDNHLSLIAKSRVKHNNNNFIPIFEKYIDGLNDQFYPEYTTADIMKHVKFSIHIRTFSVLESVISGVPAVYFQIPIFETNDVSTKYDFHRLYYTNTVRSGEPDSLFNYPGCVWNVPWDQSLDFIDKFSVKKLEQSPESRDKYCKYFCGVSTYPAAKRQMDVIESFL